jgi:hypothetical protein
MILKAQRKCRQKNNPAVLNAVLTAKVQEKRRATGFDWHGF